MINKETAAGIAAWKKKRQAVILAHNYQPPEIQSLADFLGDSLDLSRRAASVEARTIVFCGVHFMAETARIIAPEKTVLLPEPEAGCPMADMVDPALVRRMKSEHPGVPVVTYINSSAAVKAESDYICTSANAVEIVQFIPGEEIIFLPDRNLGDYVAGQTGKRVFLSSGFCPSHVRFLVPEIENIRKNNPGAVFLAHPECRREIRLIADHVLSTGGMVRWVRENDPPTVIVGTEKGMITRLKKENPRPKYIPGSDRAVCPNMKKITPEKILRSLQEDREGIRVDPETARLAARALEKMLAR